MYIFNELQLLWLWLNLGELKQTWGIHELYSTVSHAGHMYLLGKHLHQAFS